MFSSTLLCLGLHLPRGQLYWVMWFCGSGRRSILKCTKALVNKRHAKHPFLTKEIITSPRLHLSAWSESRTWAFGGMCESWGRCVGTREMDAQHEAPQVCKNLLFAPPSWLYYLPGTAGFLSKVDAYNRHQRNISRVALIKGSVV